MMKSMKFGVQLSARYYSPEDWDVLKSTALYCEQLGYDSIWFGDHLITGSSRLECWTVLSALSAITSKIRLGTLVLCNNWRNPALLAKMSATLDVISQGRLELGIGSGWNKDEHETYGYAFPEPRVRIGMLREGLEIIKRMWTEDKPSYQGKYYKISNVVCEPKPVQKPHPPITIGGSGEQLTLRAVAAYADRWNGSGPPEEYKRRLDILQKYCQRIRRDYTTIDKTYYSSMDIYNTEDELLRAMKEIYQTGLDQRIQLQNLSFEEWLVAFRSRNMVGTPEECLKKMRQLVDIGVTYYTFSIRAARKAPNLTERRKSLRLFAEGVINQIKSE
ncbi:MAG: hypothetical protein QG670_488 [Thermoproteota archaeon]|nr:hypothetical protein [Thermoproteota archaeon]